MASEIEKSGTKSSNFAIILGNESKIYLVKKADMTKEQIKTNLTKYHIALIALSFCVYGYNLKSVIASHIFLKKLTLTLLPPFTLALFEQVDYIV